MTAQIVELIDSGLYLDQQALIRYHFLNADGAGDPAVLVADYIEHSLPGLVSWQNNQYVHKSIISKVVYPTVDLQVETAITSGGTGTQSATPAPGIVTASVKWTIGPTTHFGSDAGPHIKRGGKHLSGLTDIAVDGNNFNPTYWDGTELDDWYASFATIAEDNWVLIVAHTPPAVGGVGQPVSRYAPVTGMVIQGVGSQVSRKPRHGA